MTQSDWISAKDRLPSPPEEYNAWYLVVSEGGSMEVAMWTDEWSTEFIGADEITHWMPLPPLPEVKE